MTALAIFDLDNTLVDRDAAVQAWARELVDQLGLDPAEADWIVEADGDGFAPRPAFVAALQARYRLTGPQDEVLQRYRGELVELIECVPGAAEGLARLRSAGWRLAIATNGTDRQQRAKIRRTGLAEAVDVIVTSEEAGASKPDARVFEMVARRCGLPLTEADWMVGDCATRDVGGGRGVGLRTVWMRRDRHWHPSGGPAPDAIADTVAEAVAAILRPTGH